MVLVIQWWETYVFMMTNFSNIQHCSEMGTKSVHHGLTVYCVNDYFVFRRKVVVARAKMTFINHIIYTFRYYFFHMLMTCQYLKYQYQYTCHWYWNTTTYMQMREAAYIALLI